MKYRHFFKNFLPCLLICAFTSVAGASGIGISAAVSNTSIPFEGKDTLTVTLTWEGEPFAYQIDSFPRPNLEKLIFLGSSSSVSTRPDSSIQAGEITTRVYKYILEPTDFGTGVIQPLNLTATDRVSGETRQLQTGMLTIEIAKPVPVVEKESMGTAGIAILVISVIFLGGAGYIVIRRLKKRDATDEPSEIEDLLSVLNEIKRDTVSDGKMFYSRLYRLLLQYLEKERKVYVSGKTGQEVLGVVNELEDEHEKNLLVNWLDKALKIKFRPQPPSGEEITDTYNEVRRFLENKINKK